MTAPAHHLGVVRVGDAEHITTRHALAASVLSTEDAALYRTFPGAGEDFPLLYYLGVAGQLASYLRCIPDEVTVGGVARRWAWTADNFTAPAFRGQGLSTRLQREATDHLHAIDIGRGSVFSTDVTLHIFEKLGFVIAGHAPRLLLVRSASPLLNAHVPNAALRRALSIAARPAFAAAAATLSTWNRARPSGTTCMEVADGSTPEWQRLLDRLAADQPAHFAMDVAQISRKLVFADRMGRHTVHLIHDTDSRECLAYMIVRERRQHAPLAGRYGNFQLMTLADFGFLAGNAGAAAGIADHLLRLFLASDSEVLEVISSSLLLNRETRRRGLWPVGRGMSFNWSVPAAWNWPAELRDPAAWPLTAPCGDGFTY